ncbi:acyl-CoA-binding domain-containing protein 5 [Pycnococcus provasolii]|uniref:Acyl-CoA-binding domain-containing protein 5 n=1 Tax=Pycnococcus provasolii TaxID=41880 RepID=A0A830HHK1_9CHLO|nr:acyl-CoA-binding domain-containing protein 5 [Pycnococcus provasolii]
MASSLTYPARFYAAVHFVDAIWPAGHEASSLPPLSDETRLVLWALSQQALSGPCNSPKPWSWNVVDAAKWQSWNQLGNMPPMEAMRLYVRTVEEDAGASWVDTLEPSQISQAIQKAEAAPPLESSNAPATSAASATSGGAGTGWPATNQSASDGWCEMTTNGIAPAPRTDTGCTLAGTTTQRQLFIFGGARSSRRANDAHALTLGTGTWSPAAVRPDPEVGPPPTAGARLIALGGFVYALGGRVRGAAAPTTLEVWRVRVSPAPQTLPSWERVPCGGEAPVARCGHCANLVAFGGGARVIVFGGEAMYDKDARNGEPTRRTVLADICVLDVSKLHGAGGGSMVDERGTPLAEWSSPPCGGAKPPPPLSNAASAAIGARFVAYFGGGGAVGSNVSSDLHVLDAATMTWLQLSQSTPRDIWLLYAPSERAGHAAICANGGRDLVVLGGGDGKRSLDDVWAIFNMREALLECVASGTPYNPSWTYLVECRGEAVAREGFGCAFDDAAGCCLIFGGYDGTYRNDVAVLKIPAEAPYDDAVDENGAAEAPVEKMVAVPTGDGTGMHFMSVKDDNAAASPAKLATSATPVATPPKPSPRKATTPQKAQPAASEPLPTSSDTRAEHAATKEVALMRKQLQTAQASLSAEESAHAATKEALEDARAHVMRLEVEVAELKEALDKSKGLEKEATLLRKRVEEEEKSSGGGGGLWSYISGGDTVAA